MELKITAKDGYRLGAMHYAAETSEPKGVLLVCSALGVLQSYYRHYAAHMAADGYHVYTFDYRGVGESKPEKLRGFDAQLHQWGELDITAMIDYVAEEHPRQKRFAITHSVGGQVLGFAPNNHLLDGVVMVASQGGYWKMWSGLGRSKMWMVWHTVIPTLTKTFGYLPAKKLGMFEDIPKGVALEWAKWGRHKDYMLGYFPEKETNFAAVDCPITAYSIDDDNLAPRKGVAWMATRYRNAELKLRHVRPSELGVEEVGHFGFFRKQFKPSLWQETKRFFNRLSADVETAIL